MIESVCMCIAYFRGANTGPLGAVMHLQVEIQRSIGCLGIACVTSNHRMYVATTIECMNNCNIVFTRDSSQL